ncbi:MULTISPECIES: hypothetical protein [Streptomyces]|uniref:Lipoprotein n=2 Tax=Streptomyces TaxID=1883 RepID=A0ABU4KEF6_9ACTN|nr:hypothetical protein [Streptomyces roseolus]MDX2296159.1 hypothetical protein [Streptomyces roseolus]
MKISYMRGGFIACAAAASLTVAGCSGSAAPKADKPVASTATSQRATSPQAESPSQASVESIALAKGQKGLELSVTSAERDAGGFLTIKGELRNASGTTTIISSRLSGDETEVVKHGNSLGGATLVDAVGKKRYYVLRDTEGRPLTTSGLTNLGSGKSTAVFMQFPAPPASTTEVSFQLPTFEPATLKLS